jgi:RHS repeat-associated protein
MMDEDPLDHGWTKKVPIERRPSPDPIIPKSRMCGPQVRFCERGPRGTGGLYSARRPRAATRVRAALSRRSPPGEQLHSPEFMLKGGAIYRLVKDQVGGIRLVVNAFTGEVAQELTYDAFGQVLSDSNPGFQPFGFAGGLYDADTGLVRFGARDYDAETGRWTAKDPIRFSGGINLYGYLGNEPVNLIDASGLGSDECSYYAARCSVNGGDYYCSTAPWWCERFGHSTWANCTRACLHDCDAHQNPDGLATPGYDDDNQMCRGGGELPNNSGPWNPLNSSFACHLSCYLGCGLVPGSPHQPPGPTLGYGQ